MARDPRAAEDYSIELGEIVAACRAQMQVRAMQSEKLDAIINTVVGSALLDIAYLVAAVETLRYFHDHPPTDLDA